MQGYKVPEGTKLIGATFLISWIAEQLAPHFLLPTCSNPEQQRAIAICDLMDKHTMRINELLQSGTMHAIDISDRLPVQSVHIGTMLFANEVQDYLTGIGSELELEQWPEDVHEQATTDPIEARPEPEWAQLAREQAKTIIKRQSDLDLYPSQLDIANEIAKYFRQSGIVGASGKPLTGDYIKRFALSGISSAKGRTLSTSVHRGKRGKN